MTASKAKTQKLVVAKYVGHAGVERTLTRANQNEIVGAPVATKDLTWKAGNKKLDVTDAPADVIEYLKNDPKFEVKEIEVPADEAPVDSTDTP